MADNEKNHTDPEQGGSNVGVAVIKYGTILIIFFAVLWFIIKFILPMIQL